MSLPHITPRGIAAGIFGLALALRLSLLADAADSPYAETLLLDAQEYQHLARGLLSGTWGDAAARTYVHGILFPAVWAAVEWCGGGLFALQLLQAVLGSLTCVLVYLGTRQLLPPVGAILCGISASLYWPFVLYGVQPLATTLVIFLGAALFCWLTRSRPATWHRHLGTGLLLALLGATRANTLLLVPVAAWVTYSGSTAAGVSARRSLFALCAGLVIGLTPFIAHNVSTQGTPLPFEGAWSLYIGNNADADGTPYARQGIDWQRLESIGFRDGHTATPAERGAIYLSEATSFVIDQPLTALRLALRKVQLFWNAFEIPVSVDLAHYEQQTFLGRVLPFTFGALAPLALLGMVINLRRWRRWSLAYGGVLAFLLSGVLFTVCARYRLPAVPFMLPFAAAALLRLRQLLHRRQVIPLLTHTTGLMVAIVLVHTGVDAAQVDHLRPAWLRGHIYLVQGQVQDAEREFLSALGHDPKDPDVLNSLATTREHMGRTGQAEGDYRQALRLAPDHSRAGVNLARLLGRMGRFSEAIAVASAALAADPRPQMQQETLVCLGTLRLQSGDFSAAYADLRGAIEIIDAPQARYALASVCHRLEKIDEELQHLQQAVELSPTFAAAHLNLGSLRLMLGEMKAAEKSLKRAVALQPKLATGYAHLGVLYQQTGRPDLARVALATASRLRSTSQRPPPTDQRR